MGDMEEEFTVEKVTESKKMLMKFNSNVTQGDRQESWAEWEDGVLAQMARFWR